LAEVDTRTIVVLLEAGNIWSEAVGATIVSIDVHAALWNLVLVSVVRHFGVERVWLTRVHRVSLESWVSLSHVVSVESNVADWLGNHIVTVESEVSHGLRSVRTLRTALLTTSISTDAFKLAKDLVEEAIKLWVVFDFLSAVTVSTSHSVENLVGVLGMVFKGAWLLDWEGQLSFDNHLVDIATVIGSVDDLIKEIVLDLIVGDISDDLLFRDLLDLLSVLFIDFSNFFLAFFEDFLDFIGGIRHVVSLHDDFSSLFLSLLHDLFNLRLLLLLGLFNLLVLCHLVMVGKGFETLFNLEDHDIKLFLRVDVGNGLEGNSRLKTKIISLRFVRGVLRLGRQVEDDQLVGGTVFKVISIADLVGSFEFSEHTSV